MNYFFSSFNKQFRDTAKAALKEIYLLNDYSNIFLKKFQLLIKTNHCQAVHKAKTIPDNNKNIYLI